MILHVSASSERMTALRESVAALGRSGYDLQMRPTELDEAGAGGGGYACGITVAGADHMGIIHDLSRCLADLGVNIETMNTEVVAAPMSGTPLFTMSAVISAPRELDITSLRAAVERKGDELGVSATVLSHDP